MEPFAAPTSANANPSNVCQGTPTSITLTASGGTLGDGGVTQWYTGSCGGTLVGTGNPLVISQTLNSNTTYYARYSGTCGNSDCVSTSVIIKTNAEISSVTADATSLCPSETTQITANGVSGTGATLTWFTGSGGTGTNLGSNNPLTVGSGTYYARVTGECGPPVEKSITINEKPTPTWVTNSVSPTTLCVGGQVTFSASVSGGAGGTISWVRSTTSGGAGSTVASPYTENTAGIFYYRPVYTANAAECYLADGTQTTVNVVADPTAPSLDVATPSSGTTVCVGAIVKATFNTGSGGTSCGDEYRYTTNGGGSWTSYTPGSNITATFTGTNVIQIQTRRLCSGIGCDGDGEIWATKAQWTVVADPTWVNNSVSPTTLCVGGQVTLNASISGGSGGTVSWIRSTTSGGTGSTVTSPYTENTAGTFYYRPIYTASVGGCNLADGTETMVSVVADPTAPSLDVATPSNGATICIGGVVKATFTAGSGGTGCTDEYQYSVDGGSTWNNYTPGNNITATTIGTNAVQIRVRRSCSGLGCDGAGTTWTVKVQWTVVADPAWGTNSVSPTTLCVGGQVTLNASISGGTGGTLSWVRSTTPGGVGSTVTSPHTENTVGTFYYRPVYTANGEGCNLADGTETTVNVIANPTSPSNIFASENDLCSDANITIVLSAIGGSGETLRWFSNSCGGSEIGTGNSINITSPTITTTHYARWENSCGVSACAEITINIINPPTAPSSASVDRTNFCANDAGNIELSVNGGSGSNVYWFTGSCGGTSVGIGNPLTIPSPEIITTYYARWENSCGESSCVSVIVEVNELPTEPTQALVDKPNVCENDEGNIELSVNGGSGNEVHWFTTDCGDTPIGTGNPLTISSPTVTTTYFARWENACGQSSCKSVQVSVNPKPTVTIDPSPAEVCEGSSLTLTASGSGISNYNWVGQNSHTSNTASLAINNAVIEDDGTYTVTVIGNNTCTNTASVVVTVNPLPVVIASDDCSLGVGQGVINVTNPTGANYQYSIDGGGFQASPSFGSLANGSYSIVVENTSTNCSSAPSIVTVDCDCTNPPTVTLAETSDNICGIASSYTLSGNTFGGSATGVTLSHSGGGNLNITSTTTSPFDFTYTPVASDLGSTVTITVETNNPLGSPCAIATKTFSLAILELPSITVITSNSPICEGETLTLSVTANDVTDYSWAGSGGFTATIQNPQISNATIAASGTYNVTVTGNNTCTNTSSTEVTVNPNPVVSISPITGTLCPNVGTQEITATISPATTPNYTYTWDGDLALSETVVTSSSTSSTVTATIPTDCDMTYQVTLSVSDANGCTASATPISINVNDNVAPEISGIIPDTNIEGCDLIVVPEAATTVSDLEGMGLTISDACGVSNLTVSSSDDSDGTCPIIVERTYTVTDACGNSSTAKHIIKINQADFTMPEADGSTVSCASQVTAPILPTVTDNCGNVLTPSGPVISEMPTCEGDVTYTYTYTDCAGHSHNWVYTYTIDIPMFTMVSNGGQTVSCESDAVEPTPPTINDACGNAITPHHVSTTTNVVDGSGTVTYVYSYTDCAGNTADWSYVYTVTPEGFTPVANGGSDIHCESEIVDPILPNITVCGTNIVLTLQNKTNNVVSGCGTYIYTYEYEVNGESYTWSYTYNVSPLDFTMPTNGSSTVSCASQVTAPILPTVTDYCGNVLTPSGPDISGTYVDCDGTVIYTYTYEDCAGHSHNWVYTYTIMNTTPPVVNTLGFENSSTVSCIDDVIEPTASMIPTAVSTCGEILTAEFVGFIDTPDPLTCNGTRVYNYKYTDCSGLTNTWSYTYTLNDNIAPEIGTENMDSLLTSIDCNFQVPDFIENVRNISTDNCTSTADLQITQYPLSGTIIAATTTVTVTVSDECGNLSTKDIEVIVPEPLTISISDYANQICSTPGYATVLGSGGTTPYVYSWPSTAEGVLDNTATSLTVGDYYVTITDDNLCTAVQLVTIIDEGSIAANATVNANVLCHGGNDGSITIDIFGGTPDYTINWGVGTETTNLSSHQISDLFAGDYTITVIDSHGCSANLGSITISEPVASLEVTLSSFTDVACHGGNDGSITLNIAGGTPDYTINWGVGSTTTDLSSHQISGLFAGDYTITVVDSHGCSANLGPITISEPVASLEVTLSSSTDVSCYGGNDGYISLDITGGTAPYDISWSGDGTGSENDISYPLYETPGLATGTYSFTVVDANNCTSATSGTISQPNPLVASSVADPILCNGGTTSVTVSATGGTGAYTGTGVINNVSAGTYSYTVTDANNCSAVTNITIGQPNPLVASSSAGSILCNGGTTSVTVSATGGTGAYTGTGVINNVSAGTYSYTVTDANNCSAVTNITIGQPNPLVASSSAGSILCNGGTTSVTVSATGGTGAYTGTGVINNVSAGTYSYTVTDANNCSAVTNITISQPNPLVASSSAGSILCNGGTTTVTVSATGGTGAYTGTGVINNVSAGTYSYTVTDANNCSAVTSITIGEPSLLIANANAGDILCYGGTTTVNVTATGGTGTYSGVGTINDVSAGTHSYVVTDANGCSATTQITINQPDILLVSAVVDNNVSCNGLSDAQATASATGGTEPYVYHWNDPSSSYGSTVYQLPEGSWTVQVTDHNGCTAEKTVTVTEPLVLSVTINVNDVLCFGESTGGASATVTGGTYPYSYLWSSEGQTSSSISNLSAGVYTLTVIDSRDCQAVANAVVNQSPELNVFLTSSPATCGSDGGSVLASVVGGSPDYQYMWSNASTQNNIQNVNPGTYSLTVQDSHMCIKTQSIDVDVVGNIDAQINVLNNISCFDNQDGALQAVSINGKTPLTFEWNTGATSSTLTNIGSGSYSVIITDAWGCIGNANYVMIEPAQILVHADIQGISCYGLSDGAIYTQVSGGHQPYNYLWSNAETSASISNLQAGLYSLTVYDNFGCQQIQSYELGQPDKLEISLDIKDISCFGDNDGGVKISATGGTQPYLYELAIEDSIYIGQMHAPLSTGTYVAYVRDMNSCIDTALFMLISPAPLEATYVFESPSCFGARDGYIEFSVAGGVEPYLFETNNAIVDIPLLSGLSAGNYTVIITDAHDCSLEFKGIILSESDIDCIRIPNAFTPNGDGINDTWIIENLLMFSGARIYVYNRWGQEIWVGYPGDEWDGKYNSKLMPATTYLYVIELYDGSKPYTGTVTIIY